MNNGSYKTKAERQLEYVLRNSGMAFLGIFLIVLGVAIIITPLIMLFSNVPHAGWWFILSIPIGATLLIAVGNIYPWHTIFDEDEWKSICND